VSDFWSEMLEGGDSKSEGSKSEDSRPEDSKPDDGKARGREGAAERKFRIRLPAFGGFPRVRMPSIPRVPRPSLPSIPSVPRLRLPGFLSNPRSHFPDFLGDLPGVAARRWTAMLLAFAVGLACTVWILAGAQLLYRAQATALITGPAVEGGLAPQAMSEGAVQSIGEMLDSVFSDESLSGLIDRFDLYSESGDAQPAALVAHMLGSIDVEPMPSLAQRNGGEPAMAYGFTFTSGDPIQASAVANALVVRFQEVAGERNGAPQAGDESTAPGSSDSEGPSAAELAQLKAKLASAQAELARLNDPGAEGSAPAGASAFQVSMLDPATPPSGPLRTRTFVALVGLLASLLLAVGVACLLELVDPAVLSADQLARFSDMPILGSLPRIA